jgi:Post-segregation antitoxin CcdA
MRMARVNVTIPDELIRQARAAGLNVSRFASSAIEAELERRVKIAALEAYLVELDAELGPLTQAERDAASEWGDQFDASSGTSGAA